MPLLLIAAGGIALLAMLARKSAPTAASAPSGGGPSSALEKPPEVVLPAVPLPSDATDRGARVGAAAAGLVATAASLAAIGGAVALEAGAVVALGVGGALLAMEVDKALGGTGHGDTGIVAAGGGFLVGVVVGLALFGVVGWVCAAVVLAIAALTYAVTSVVTDLNRLAYGQEGARADYSKQWREAYERFAAATASQPAPKELGEWNDATLARVVTPIVDGYMQQLNRLAFLTWMARPRGVGRDDAYHALFGQERGYFCGRRAANGELADEPALEVTGEPYRRSLFVYPLPGKTVSRPIVFAARWKWRPAEEVALEQGDASGWYRPRFDAPPDWLRPEQLEQSEADAVRYQKLPPTQEDRLFMVGAVKHTPPSEFVVGPDGKTHRLTQWLTLTWIPVMELELVQVDLMAEVLQVFGRTRGNIDQWKASLVEPWGAVVANLFEHATNKQREGRFVGALKREENGRPLLDYQGVLWDSQGVRFGLGESEVDIPPDFRDPHYPELRRAAVEFRVKREASIARGLLPPFVEAAPVAAAPPAPVVAEPAPAPLELPVLVRPPLLFRVRNP